MARLHTTSIIRYVESWSYSHMQGKRTDGMRQWNKFPEPHSWMDVITQAQDGFFAGTRTNPYGELWGGPSLEGFDRDDWKR